MISRKSLQKDLGDLFTRLQFSEVGEFPPKSNLHLKAPRSFPDVCPHGDQRSPALFLMMLNMLSPGPFEVH